MTLAVTDFILLVSESVSLSILVKASFILVLGFAAGAIASRSQASWRHLIFATTFAAVLALPLVAFTVPELAVVFETQAPVEVQKQSSTTNDSAATIFQARVAAARETSTPTSSGWVMPAISVILFSAWIVGAVLLLVSMAIDLLRVRELGRHGIPSETLRGTIDRLTVDAGMKPVAVLLHEKIKAPVTFGFFRPVIMLPIDAEAWRDADLQRALVHELEHIRRGDWATQMAGRIACAFYWFHPLIWMAWRKLCLEAERACDDAVVQTAENTEYAEQLVSLSRQLKASPSVSVLGMAKRSDLAMRITSLLDTSRGRGRATAAAAVLAVFIASLVVIVIGPLRAVAQQAAASSAAGREVKKAAAGTTSDDHDGDGDGRGDGRGDGIGRGDGNGDGDDDDDDIAGNPLDVALFKAAERNSLEKVKPLIDQGANVNVVLQGDGTPLIAAAREGHVEMVRLLLDSGAKPDLGVSGDGTPLQNAAQKGQREVVMLLLDRGADINTGIEGDGNPLIMASGAGHMGVVSLLLERGADIHKVINGDENAIIKAAEQGQLEMIKFLVSKGADINSRVKVDFGNGGKRMEEIRTPLSQARKNGHTAVVEYLLSAGAR